MPNICVNYAYLLHEVYTHDKTQKEEEEEEEMSQLDYNPPSDTNQLHVGKKLTCVFLRKKI